MPGTLLFCDSLPCCQQMRAAHASVNFNRIPTSNNQEGKVPEMRHVLHIPLCFASEVSESLFGLAALLNKTVETCVGPAPRFMILTARRQQGRAEDPEPPPPPLKPAETPLRSGACR